MIKLFFFKAFTCCLFLLFSCSAGESTESVKAANKEPYGLEAQSNEVVIFYNVENLFDTINNPNKEDDQFLPQGELNWTSKRYWKKIENLSKVIKAINSSPAVIGLAEIENKSVLLDLAKTLGENYVCITEESNDKRGIDVGVIYNSNVFKPITHQAILIDYKHPGTNKIINTRDILYVRGELNGKEISLFVNHWPSRREGQRQTEPKRLFAAKKLRQKVDEVFSDNPRSNILIMGDFNDYPTDKSISELGNPSLSNQDNSKTLFNLVMAKEKLGEGSHNYRGDWGFLDQMLISQSLLDGKSGGISVIEKECKVFKKDWMLFKHPKSKELLPNRTYSGKRYYGGYSDHLPIYINFDIKN